MPLMWASLAFLGGIAVEAKLHPPLDAWLMLAFLVILSALFFPLKQSRSFKWTVAAGAIAMLAGAARYQFTTHTLTPSDVAWFNDRKYEVLVTAYLVEPPDYRDTYTNLRVEAAELDTGKDVFPVHDLLLARIPPNQTYHYGDIVRLRGKLETPPSNEDFSYQEYLARQGILSYISNAEVTLLPGNAGNPIIAAAYALKEKALDNVYRLFPDPEASLLAGILLGVDSGLPGALQQAYKDTGTAHIIAISGFNISIIAGIFFLFFSRALGQRRGAVAAILGIAFYTFLVGASAAVVRAALMGALSLFAMQVGRRQQGLNTLAFVAALMALWNPLIIWDAGFQLSFFATLGLILYGEPFQQAAERCAARFFPASDAQQIAKLLGDYVLLTLAAQLTTLPIMAFQFKQISLVSIIANPFILPAQPAVMILGGLAVIASLVIFPIGQIMAWMAWPLTAYTNRLVEFFDSLPHGVIYLSGFSLGYVALFYAALFTVTFGGSRLKEIYASLSRRFKQLPAATILAALFIGTLLTWRLAAYAPDGRLHITFLNVGSADAVLIKTPAGRNILINGGPSSSVLSDALGQRLSFFDRNLDWLIVASTDENQIASLPRVLQRYSPQNVLWSGNRQASFSSRSLAQFLADQSIPVTQAREGQAFDLGGGAALKVLNVSPLGSTLLVEWNDFRLLLPIGANLDTLDQLQNGSAIQPVTVLLLAQSGYAPLSPPSWIANLNPQLAVLSVAAGDINGLPDQETLDALAGRSLLRTDRNGWIQVMTDGKQMWVSVQKKP
jgi:competence protein ComEC